MNRRSLLLGVGAALAAPAIVRADSLMKLWVPPKPKLILDPGPPDYEGSLWTKQGQVAGWWRQKDGRIDFNYVNPDPQATNGVLRQSGTNNRASTAMEAIQIIGVTPYPPLPAA